MRDLVDVKLLCEKGEFYIMARSDRRVSKERGSRRLKKLWRRLKKLETQTITGDSLLLKLAVGKKEACGRWENATGIRW